MKATTHVYVCEYICITRKKFYGMCSLTIIHFDIFYSIQFLSFFFFNMKTMKVFTWLPNHVATNSLKNRDWEHTVPVLNNILCRTESKRLVQAKWITFIDFMKWHHLSHLNVLQMRLLLFTRWGIERFPFHHESPFVPFEFCTRWVHHPFEKLNEIKFYPF